MLYFPKVIFISTDSYSHKSFSTFKSQRLNFLLIWFVSFLFICLFVYLFLERVEGREKERERNINMWLPLVHPLLGTGPATQACALTGNWTNNPLLHSLVFNPLSHTSQGLFWFVSVNHLLTILWMLVIESPVFRGMFGMKIKLSSVLNLTFQCHCCLELVSRVWPAPRSSWLKAHYPSGIPRCLLPGGAGWGGGEHVS